MTRAGRGLGSQGCRAGASINGDYGKGMFLSHHQLVAASLTHRLAQDEIIAAKEAELQALAARLAAFEGVPPE